jgi:hypothetical protein
MSDVLGLGIQQAGPNGENHRSPNLILDRLHTNVMSADDLVAR